MRGTFEFLAEEKAYANTDKVWYVSLQQSDCFWMDLLIDPPLGRDGPNWIKEYLSELKGMVEASLAKRFIYMYGSRTKVRFDHNAPLRTAPFSRQKTISLRVGREGRRMSVPWDPSVAPDLLGLEVTATPKLISFHGPEKRFTFSVHDFLRTFGVGVGDSTAIHYVGMTKNPHSRPLDRQHRGYADMLYGVGTEDRDFFLFVSLFKVLSISTRGEYGVRFMLANAMTDEVPTQEEGALIENAFIAYFDSKFQDETRAGERARLKSELRRLREQNNIREAVLDFELSAPCPYFRLSSDVRAPSDRHVFRVSLVNEDLKVEPLPHSFDLNAEVLG